MKEFKQINTPASFIRNLILRGQYVKGDSTEKEESSRQLIIVHHLQLFLVHSYDDHEIIEKSNWWNIFFSKIKQKYKIIFSLNFPHRC